MPFTNSFVPLSGFFLEKAYLRHLDEIDAANMVRHHNEEEILPYPSLDEFVAQLRDEPIDADPDDAPRFDAVVGTLRMVDPGFDEMPLAMMLPLPKPVASEDESVAQLFDAGDVWITAHGVFVFDSVSKH